MWNYEEPRQERIPDGDYRLTITHAEEVLSRSGKEMLRLTCAIPNFSKTLNFHIIYDTENRDRTNRNLRTMFNSFGIPEGCFDFDKYVGCEGAGHIETDERGMYENIRYLLTGERKNAIPAVGYDKEVPF